MGYYDQMKDELQNLINQFESAQNDFDRKYLALSREMDKVEQAKEAIVQLAKERQKGFPWLAKAYDDFFKLQDRQLVKFLKNKKISAVSASVAVSEQAKLRRMAEKEKKIYQYLVEYYEAICPFLIDLKEEVAADTESDNETLAEYTEEERQDSATGYLTKAEYRKLPTEKRNQIALDRYWKRPKSKWHIGKIYERYVGYLYEEKGYDVEYHGIFKGLEDLGRDVIATKGNEIIVIQCKNWSKFKTIYENHIFQFFGTVFQYKDANRDKDVKAVFYATTKVSDLARRFAQELSMDLMEEFKMNNNYPCIKCNISKVDGSKIYHLPMDQQYDTVKVEPEKGEIYCQTVKEAEEQGFRRAYKYKGLSKKK